MLKKERKGQSLMEYIILFVILIVAFIAMSNYIKRGIQGRWKTAVDELGDQYDPRFAHSDVRHSINASVNTIIQTFDIDNGFWTERTDNAITVDRKTGRSEVGGF